MTISEVYRASLAASGKLKLKAKARLADGAPYDVFEACVLLHETARMERRAVEALTLCPPETRLLASIEECWSLVEGLDPPEAGEAWGRILRERSEVDEGVARAMLLRLTPKYLDQQRAFAEDVNGSATMMRLRDAQRLVTTSATERKKARREVASLLATYPGTRSFWWMAYRLAEADDDKTGAWDALTKARRLAPDNPRFEAMSLLVGTWALSVQKADEHLARVRGRFESAGAEACLMYALAEMQLARRTRAAQRAIRWQRARAAAQAGLSQANSEGLHKNLRAAEMLTATLLAGDKPTVDILYRAGLTSLAVISRPRADVVELFTRSARTSIAA